MIKFILYSILSAVIFLFVYSLLMGVPINSTFINGIQQSISKTQNSLTGSTPLLGLIMYPEEYEGQEISYKKITLKSQREICWSLRPVGKCYTISAQEEDGTWVRLPVVYRRSLMVFEKYDIKGIIKEHEGVYYLELTEVVMKD